MMKNRFYLKGLIGLFLLAVIAGGCKKEEVVPTFAEMSFDAEEVLSKLPAGLTSSTDEYAQQCVGFIESAVDMSGFMGNMVPPDNAQKTAKKSSMGGGDTWTWTWSYGAESFTFYWTYDEDNTKKYWSMDIQFGSGPTYDYIDAWEMKDGSQGEVVYNFNWVYIYGEDPIEDYEELYWKYTWRTDGTGAYYFNWYMDSDDEEYVYFLHYDVTINADGSGFVDYYLADELFYHMEWDALGSGSWVYYIGDSELYGTWTAG